MAHRADCAAPETREKTLEQAAAAAARQSGLTRDEWCRPDDERALGIECLGKPHRERQQEALDRLVRFVINDEQTCRCAVRWILPCRQLRVDLAVEFYNAPLFAGESFDPCHGFAEVGFEEYRGSNA